MATGNPLDKAGAYAIQYAGFQPVDLERFAGCFANVMGLPVCRLLRLLAATSVGLASGVGRASGVGPGTPQPPGDCEHFEARACPIVHQIAMESAR